MAAPNSHRTVRMLAALALVGSPVAAQVADTVRSVPRLVALPNIGSVIEDQVRTDQVLTGSATDGYLIRSPSVLLGQVYPGISRSGWSVVVPQAHFTWNSGIPFAQNDDGAWTGRGVSARVEAGVHVVYGPATLLLVPEADYAQNQDFDEFLPRNWRRGSVVLPWRVSPPSVDLPIRQGNRSLSRVGLGQSSLSVNASGVVIGAATESQWWGPGIRNAIVMSNNAPGIPHLFVRTRSPARTPLGDFEAKAIVGELEESAYFDSVSSDDARSLSALVATFRPLWEPNLTLGATRSVYGKVSGRAGVLARSGDALLRWKRRNDPSVPRGERYDQLFSFFGRWVFPRDGLEVYGEWARQDVPSLPDFFEQPGYSQGYTFGVQGARRLAGDRSLRLQAEVTDLEQAPRGRPLNTFYTSAAVEQGYTHRGQVIGAAIGPGASSQWLAADLLSSGWRVGVFGGRVRWDNDAYYGTPRATTMAWAFLGHDVSVYGGARGSYDFRGFRVDAELVAGDRLNFLFQNRGQSWETADDAVDVRDRTLRLSITPLPPRRRSPNVANVVSPQPLAPLQESVRAAPDSVSDVQANGSGTPPLPGAEGRRSDRGVDGRGEVFAGSEFEEYLRTLQLLGDVPLYPWSVRSFSPRELDRLAPRVLGNPWELRYPSSPHAGRGARIGIVPPTAQVLFNSAFPYGFNDGPVWAGRGLTTAVQFGATMRYGPLSVVLAPMAFWAQNSDFRLESNGLSGRRAFADAREPNHIDLPQRFGESAYTRIDPGQSTVRVDWKGVAAGLSTANQAWGPASRHPLLLGNNAPGFLHGFLGTSDPVNLRIARVHGRIVWGRLEQSEYSPSPADSALRFMSGLVLTATPAGLSGLEIGGARFFHAPWPGGGLSMSNFLTPLDGLFKASTSDPYDQRPGRRAENQLVSVFARWVAPRSGFEVYGEYAREDASWDLRDFLLEPDHARGYNLGFRKVWPRSDGILVSLRGEVLNTQIPHIVRVRYEGPFYRHTYLNQGHTNRGQLLGSASGYGGGGSVVAADYYHPRGRWTLSLARDVRDHQALVREPTGKLDVLHSVGVESLYFFRRLDVTGGVTGVREQNRDLASGAFNLNATLRVRLAL